MRVDTKPVESGTTESSGKLGKLSFPDHAKLSGLRWMY